MYHHLPPRPAPETPAHLITQRPTRELNVLWLLLILLTVTASVHVDLDTATAELRHEELRGWQKTICDRLPDGAAFADVFDLDERPRLRADDGQRDSPDDDFDRGCEWMVHSDRADRQLLVELDDADDHPEAGLDGPRLELSGAADAAELTPPYLGPAGGVSLHSRIGDTTLTVTVVDQTDIESVVYGATNGSFPYRRLIADAATATAEAWALIGHPGREPAPPSNVDGDLPPALCDHIDVPGSRLEPVAAVWPPTSEAAGRCEWRTDSEPAEIFYVRVDTATAVPAAGTTATETARWLWDIRDPEVGDEIADLGPDSAIGVDDGLGGTTGGVYFRWHEHLIQVFHRGSGDEDASTAALLRTARQLADLLEPND